MQHFLGWEIETETAVFHPDIPTLFDFRTPQKGSTRFFYILPFSERRALVEYTLFSPSLLEEEAYISALETYLADVMGLTDYRVLEKEQGIIPMTDQPFPRQAGKRIMNIGTKGGVVKASSGYAFLRIQQDSQAIVRSLVRHGHPFAVPASPYRYRQYDSIMLQVMSRRGDMMKQIFTALFRNNPVQTVFRFLDEEASLSENLPLLASLPRWPFLEATFRLKLLGKV